MCRPLSEHTCAPDGEGKCVRSCEVRFGNLDYATVHMIRLRALMWAEVGAEGGELCKIRLTKLWKSKSVIHEGEGILVSSFCLFNSVLLLLVLVFVNSC